MEYLPYLAYALGALARVVIPYLIANLKEKQPFDTRYLLSQILGAAIALVPLLSMSEQLAEIGSMAIAAAFAAGWFSADVGRLIDKSRMAVSKPRDY